MCNNLRPRGSNHQKYVPHARMTDKKQETQLRLSLIEHGTDPETAKLLIEQKEKKNNKYGTLRGGCVLLGAGLGAACNGFFGVSSDDIYFWLAIAAGMGIGLLIAFVIEYKLTKREAAEEKGLQDR